MLRVLDSLMNGIAISGQNRKVQTYLDDATTDSILLDLSNALRPQIEKVAHLRYTFQQWCSQEPAQSPYWTMKSFQSYIQSAHAGLDPTEVALLWQCLTFHAYHPFPPHATAADVELDLNAFIRGAALLAARGTESLGMQDDGGHYWMHDAEFFRRADFHRILRSLGRPAPPSSENEGASARSDAQVEDTVHVLAMVVPYFIHGGASPDTLAAAANRLLHERSSFAWRSSTSRSDLRTLLQLILRTSLEKTTWGQGLHSGSFDAADPADEILADSLLTGVLPDSVEDDLSTHTSASAMEVLPNIQLRFYQLWSVIFQPEPSNSLTRSIIAEEVPARILRATALFVPQQIATSSMESYSQFERYVLEPVLPRPRDEDVMSFKHVMDLLGPDLHPHLVLCSSDRQSPEYTALGAYFPSPVWEKRSPELERHSVMSTSSHLLFQLQPRFRVLRWTGPRLPLTDLLHPKGEGHDSEAEPGRYTIGVSEDDGTALRIDSKKQKIALIYRKSSAKNRYEPLALDNGGPAEDDWSVTAQDARVDVFRGTGPVEPETKLRNPPTKHIDGSVQGAELKSRITGFGPKT